MHPSPISARTAFTLVELLTALAVGLVLVGLLLGGVVTLRERSRAARAVAQLQLIQTAMESYRNEDAQHRYPTVHAADRCLSERGHGGSPGILGLMDARGYLALGSAIWDEERRLADPWLTPYRYDLVRPTVAAPAPAFQDWNWDAEAGRERRHGMRRDPATGAVAAGPLEFPYLWSLGRGRSDSDSTTWIHPKD